MTHSGTIDETILALLNDAGSQTLELCGKPAHLATLIKSISVNGSRAAMITTETASVEQFKSRGLATDRWMLRFAVNSVQIKNTLTEILRNRPKYIFVELPKQYDGTRFGLLAFIEENSKKYPSVRFILLSEYEDAELPSPASTRIRVREEVSVLTCDTVVTVFKVQRVPVFEIFHTHRLSFDSLRKIPQLLNGIKLPAKPSELKVGNAV